MEKIERVPRHVVIDENAGTFEQYDLVDADPGTTLLLTTADDKHELTKVTSDRAAVNGWDYEGDAVRLTMYDKNFRSSSVIVETGKDIGVTVDGENISRRLGVVAKIAVRMGDADRAAKAA